MGAGLHGCVLVCHCRRQAHIRVRSSSGWGETSIWRDCPQLKLRVPELPTHPKKRVLPTLQGEVADRNERRHWLLLPSERQFRELLGDRYVIAWGQSIHSLHNADAP